MRRRHRSRIPRLLIMLLIVALIGFGAFVAYGRGLLSGAGSSLPGVASVSHAIVPPSTPTPVRQQADDIAKQFFQLWDKGQFDNMYAMLSDTARSQITQDKFTTRYRNIGAGIGMITVTVTVNAPQLTSVPGSAQQDEAKVPFKTVIDSSYVGKITDESNEMSLVLQSGKWKIDWSPSLIFKGLSADNSVQLIPDYPVRGSIVDRNGKLLAGPGKVLSIGVIPGEIKDEAKVLTALSGYQKMKSGDIKAKYANAKPDWWVPLGDYPISQMNDAKAKLGNLAGVGLREKDARVYPNGSAAAHTIGYVSQLNADELKTLAPKGYMEGDVIGRTGIEAWGEDILAGQKGGKLILVGPDGTPLRTIAARPAKPGGTIQLTLDTDVQKMAEQALGSKVGSLVVMDPRDNSILALVSHPAFDPNAFILGMSNADWQKLSGDKNKPFQDRPLESSYPTGSIFKVITMAAGLEKGGFHPDSMFDTSGRWTLPGTNQVFHNWVPNGHGRVSLVMGLAESDDVVFYEVGYKLYTIDPNIVPTFARAFGLGQPTGIVGLPEVAGTLPDPAWKQRTIGQPWYPGDSVNLGIGQGYLEATPLQMANVYSTLAAGGILRMPLLVKKIGDGPSAQTFTAKTEPSPPVSAASYAAIRDGMKLAATDPNGTANYAFKGFRIPTAAKTGSAENQNPDAHAWFAGYAPADKPEVVALVMVEGGREGPEVAAPIGRALMEAYFAGR